LPCALWGILVARPHPRAGQAGADTFQAKQTQNPRNLSLSLGKGTKPRNFETVVHVVSDKQQSRQSSINPNSAMSSTQGPALDIWEAFKDLKTTLQDQEKRLQDQETKLQDQETSFKNKLQDQETSFKTKLQDQETLLKAEFQTSFNTQATELQRHDESIQKLLLSKL